MRIKSCLLVVTTLLCLGGYGSPGAWAADDDKVSLRLAWMIDTQSAGYIMAKSKGFYKASRLDVDILAGGPNINSTAMVASGANTFGTNDSGEVFFGRSEGMKLVMVAACIQKFPGGVMALGKSEIKEPADLIGKTLAYNEGGSWVFTQAMLAKAGVDVRRVHTVVAIGNEVLMSGRVDAKTAFATNEPIALDLAGYKTTILLPADYGIKAYAEAVFTDESILAAKPDMVRRFVAATVQGWDYAIAHPDETVREVVKAGEDLNPEQEKRQFARLLPFVVTEETKSRGTCSFDTDTLQQTEDTLIKYGGLKSKIPIDKMSSTDYLPRKP
jgi:NitT/TauT family transport system substrate-binding protein